jgi:hypothetical protein
MPSRAPAPVDQLWLGQLPKKQQTSTAWVIESPIAAIESGRDGACAEAEAAGTTAARSRATPRVSARKRLGISDLPGRVERDDGQRMTDLAVTD